MTLRQEAIEALCVHHVPTCGSHTEDLDALLGWLDTNAASIAESTFTVPPVEDAERGRPHVITVEAEIRVLVAVLREDRG